MKSPDLLYQEIADDFSDDSPEECIGALEMFLAIYPDYAMAHNDVGVLYFSTGDKERALKHYDRAVSLAPENPTFMKNLADFYYVELGRVKEAMELYVKILSANPYDIEVLLALGRICISQGLPDRAEIFFRQVLDSEPWNSDAKHGLEELGKEVDGGQGSGVRGQGSGVGGQRAQDGWMDGGVDDLGEDGGQRSGGGGQGAEHGKKEYLVSAIVSTYNSERFIRGCLEDLEAQTIADKLEIIVVDSGSEQNEAVIVKEFQAQYDNIKYIRTEERETVYAAWNRGIKASSGKYITNANTDDRHRRDGFEVMVNILETLPEVVLVYADLLITETENETFEHCTPVATFRWLNWDRKELLKGSCFIGPQPMWRRSVHEEYGLFDDAFVTSGDYEFWLRISQTHTFLHIPVLLGLYLQFSGSIEHQNQEQKTGENKRIVDTYRSAHASKKVIGRQLTGEAEPIVDVVITDDSQEGQAGIIPMLQGSWENHLVSVIVLGSGSSKRTRTCLESIKRCTDEPYEIILIDQSKDKQTDKWLKKAFRSKTKHNRITVSEDSGYSQCANTGISASSGEYIVLIHDHVRVCQGWLESMLECVKSHNDIGIVGHLTSQEGTGIQFVERAKAVAPEEFETFAQAFRETNRYRRIPSRYLANSLMLFSGRLVQKVGLFDENLEHSSSSEDFCLRSSMKGYENVIAGDVLVQCKNGLTKNNKRAFQLKWRGIDLKTSDGKRLAMIKAFETAEGLYQRGDIDQAVGALVECLKYSPDEVSVYHRLTHMLINHRRFKEGLEVLKPFLENEQVDPITLSLAANCEEGLELNQEAESMVDRALSMDPMSAAALNLKGVLAYKRGDKRACQTFLEKALEADPGHGETYTNLGILFWEAENKKEALRYLEKGCRLAATNENSIAAYLSVVSEMAAFGSAENLLREAKTLYPQNRRILLSLVDILMANEKYRQALQEVQKATVRFGVDDDMLATGDLIIKKLVHSQDGKQKKRVPNLSLCMIVKNEEQSLGRCLASVSPLVDEMVIVDTGSTDRTKDIGKIFGAKILDFVWTGDFSEARNFALSKASGDWILVLDADEVVSDSDHEELKKAIRRKNDGSVAYSITTRNYVVPMNVPGWVANDGTYTEEEAGAGWYPSPKVRLFPNDPRIRFRGRVHELVEPSLKKIGMKSVPCSVPVHHYGKLVEDKNLSKGEAYYVLGKQKIEDEGGDIKALIELAKQASELKRHDEAIELWQQVIGLQDDQPIAYLNLSNAYMEVGNYQSGLEASKKAVNLDINLKEAALNYATCALCVGNPEHVVKVLDAFLQHVPDHPVGMALLSVAHCIVGNNEKAFEMMRLIKKMGFECSNYLNELSERLVSAERITSAISVLKAAVESGNATEAMQTVLEDLRWRNP